MHVIHTLSKFSIVLLSHFFHPNSPVQLVSDRFIGLNKFLQFNCQVVVLSIQHLDVCIQCFNFSLHVGVGIKKCIVRETSSLELLLLVSQLVLVSLHLSVQLSHLRLQLRVFHRIVVVGFLQLSIVLTEPLLIHLVVFQLTHKVVMVVLMLGMLSSSLAQLLVAHLEVDMLLIDNPGQVISPGLGFLQLILEGTSAVGVVTHLGRSLLTLSLELVQEVNITEMAVAKRLVLLLVRSLHGAFLLEVVLDPEELDLLRVLLTAMTVEVVEQILVLLFLFVIDGAEFVDLGSQVGDEEEVGLDSGLVVFFHFALGG